MDKLTALALAYFVIWTLIFLYTLVLGQRQKQINKELTLIKDVLNKRS
ncbi:CcmD family protein [Carboxydothermus pertinax]|uniref:CcmD family protein n=1 Tax=Carboxydothermus pertinax TaxID=870242 RepID=A0A1L8CXM7_9THEO|nr:CcmD family protein [Carboxydothermus pertinax]GAV23624.1 hypothetical protein cpu_21340 [Carboxydothermus pertinax]